MSLATSFSHSLIARAIVVLGAFTPALAGLAGAQAVKPHGDAIFTPTPGQIGKDVMWLGSPEPMVGAMLRAARTGPNDLVIDLGAGDGRIPIAAARDFGAQAIGIEYDPKMAALAARNAERAGVADRVRIIEGDLFNHDFTRATVLTLYLLPEINLQLRPGGFLCLGHADTAWALKLPLRPLGSNVYERA